MVVVAVVGVLALIAIPGIQKARNTARRNMARSDLRVISSAADQLAFDTGKWPGGVDIGIQGNSETWDLSTDAAGFLANDGRFRFWRGPYLDEMKTDPWGSPYFFDPDYQINGQWTAVVGSFGPNGEGQNSYDADDLYVVQETF